MQLTKAKRKIISLAVIGAILLSFMASTMPVNAAPVVAVTNATPSLNEEQIDAIRKAVMANIEKNYAGVYAFDHYNITVHNQTEADEDDISYVDVDVLVYMTLIRNPEDSPYVVGMRDALEGIADADQKEFAKQAYDAYLQKVMPYYNLPILTGFLYRIYIPTIMLLDSAYGFGFEMYHRTGVLSKVMEDEQFTEIWQYADGVNFINDVLNGAAAGASSTFHAQSAVAYAVAHATDVPEYSEVKGNGSDCANFVSKCINTGGIPRDRNWRPGSANWIRTGYYNKKGIIPYLTRKGYFKPVSSAIRATEGSIMYYNTKSHVAIVTMMDGSAIRYSHHSSKPKNAVYYVYNSRTDDVKFYVPQ